MANNGQTVTFDHPPLSESLSVLRSAPDNYWHIQFSFAIFNTCKFVTSLRCLWQIQLVVINKQNIWCSYMQIIKVT